jgi:hypothetical protein
MTDGVAFDCSTTPPTRVYRRDGATSKLDAKPSPLSAKGDRYSAAFFISG